MGGCSSENRGRMHGFRSLPHRTLLALQIFQFATCAVAQEGADNEKFSDNTVPPVLRVTSWNDMPYSGIAIENGTWVGKGYAFSLLELLSKKLKFTYTIVPPKSHGIGDEHTGIMNILYEQEADMAAAFIPVITQFRKYCTFSTALDETQLTALMKRPQESATGSGLLAPFDETVWLFVLIAIVSMGPIIYLFAFIRAKLWRDPVSEKYNLPSYVWFVYSSLLKQGTGVVATTDSTRMLFATWWVFILILTSFYTANLTAFLTKPQFTLPINSLQDIVHKGYRWFTYEGRTIEYLLSQNYPNELSVMKRTRWRGDFISTYEEPESIFERVNKKQLFLAESHYLQTLIFEDYKNKTRKLSDHASRCTYVVMPGSIYVKDRAFAFPINSTIKGPIDKELLALVEAGIVAHEKNHDLPMAEVCPVDLHSTDRRLRNNDLSLTYKVMIGGYITAILVFLIEMSIGIFRNCKGKRRAEESQEIYPVSGARKKKVTKAVEKKDVPPYNANELLYNEHGSTLLKRSTPNSNSKNASANAIQGQKHSINGRDYYVVIDRGGDQRLIPIRTPSAFLFQYAA